MDRTSKTEREFVIRRVSVAASAETQPPRPVSALQRGFTLPETIITLAIAGVLVGMAAPSLHSLLLNNRMTVEVNTLMAALQTTRSEAVKRRQVVTLCPSRDGQTCTGPASDYTWWHKGALLFVDSNDNDRRDDGETVVRVFQEASGGLTIKTSRARQRVNYQPNGFSSGTNPTFAFCDARGMASVRYVIVSNTGRPRISRKSDSDLRCP